MNRPVLTLQQFEQTVRDAGFEGGIPIEGKDTYQITIEECCMIIYHKQSGEWAMALEPIIAVGETLDDAGQMLAAVLSGTQLPKAIIIDLRTPDHTQYN